jgi:4-amino-4-deoxychorismate lyase
MIIHLTNKSLVELMYKSSVFSNACGVFETLLVVNEKLIFLDRHLKRLNTSLQFFNVHGVITEDMIYDNLFKNRAYHISNQTSYALKLIVYFEGEIGYLHTQSMIDPYLNFDWYRGMKIKLLEVPVFSQSPLNYHKTINYLDKLYFSKQIKKLGLDEGIRINEFGNITEGLKSNLFIFDGHQWLTPPVEDGLLPGIARIWFMEVMSEKGYTVKEKSITSKDLNDSKLAVLSNSLIGCSLVNSNNYLKSILANDIIMLNSDYRGGHYGTT